MAIQFPDFLRVPVTPRDYSGVSDAVSNYYAGYNMPKDAMIKAVQAKFAEPNAQEDLRSTQLRNAYQAILNQYAPESQKQSILSTRLANQQAQTELSQQAELERQLRIALSGGNPGAMPTSSSQPMLPNTAMPPNARMPMPSGGQAPLMTPQSQIPPQLPPAIASRMTAVNPAAMLGGDMGNAPTAPSGGSNAPNAPVAPVIATNALPASAASAPAASDATVITEGAPNLAGVDALYDSSPLSRAFLEKKGFKKTQEVKFDNKTGRTTVLTKYPSGKVTMQSSGGVGGNTDEGFPLTNKMISKHQGIISSVDVAVPVLKQLADMGSYPRQSWVKGDQYAQYQGLVSQAVDSVLGSFGLPMTNEGLQTIKDQIEIKTFETPSHYKKRITKLIDDLRSRQKYSAGEVKKSNKIQPIDTSASGNNADSDNTYSSNDWEAV